MNLEELNQKLEQINSKLNIEKGKLQVISQNFENTKKRIG